jgi:hypothetical protein
VSTHVTTIGNQARCLPETQLNALQGFTHGGQNRDRRCQAAAFFSPDCPGNIVSVQEDGFLPVLSRLKSDVQPGRNFCYHVVRGTGPAALFSSEPHQPIQGTAIQQVPSQGFRNVPRNGSLAGATRSIDRQYRN